MYKYLLLIILALFLTNYFILKSEKPKACESSSLENNDSSFLPLYKKMFLSCGKYQNSIFYKTGLGHLLTVSGLHIGSIFLFVFLLSNIILKFFIKKTSYLYISSFLSIFIVFLYIKYIGIEIPRLRAFIMLLMYVLTFYFNFFRNKIFILFSSALIIVFIFPHSLSSYSFYYSFACVFSILISKYFKFVKPYFINACLNIFLFLIPINLHASGNIEFFSPVVNLLFIPIFTFYFPLAGFLFFSSYVFGFSFILLDFITSLFLKSLEIISHFYDFFIVNLININIYELIFLYILIFLLLIIFKYKNNFNKKRVVCLYLLITILSCYLIFIISRYNLSDSYIINYELGSHYRMQGAGDIILIKLEDKILVIDTGHGGKSTYSVIRKIRSLKIDKIDYLILTHMHEDHIGGLEAFIENFRITSVISNDIKIKDMFNNSNFYIICEGYELNFKNAKITFLTPLCNAKKSNNENRNALSFLLYYNNFIINFNSDLPKSVAKKNFKKNKNYKNIIYQLPHHCSYVDNDYKFLENRPLLGFCTSTDDVFRKSFNFPIFNTGSFGDILINLKPNFSVITTRNKNVFLNK